MPTWESLVPISALLTRVIPGGIALFAPPDTICQIVWNIGHLFDITIVLL